MAGEIMSGNVQKKRRIRVKDQLHFALPHVEGFRHWLEHRGYTRGTVTGLVEFLAHWTGWVHEASFTLDTIHAGHDASAAALKGWRMGREWLRAGALFIRYLEEQEAIPLRPKPASPTQLWPILGAFRDWMRIHRGLAQSTLDTYQTTLVDLLQTLGDGAQTYTPQAIRAFVLDRARPHGLSRAKSVAVATRAFLRYMVATGQCPAGREYAVPGFAGWQLTSVPDFLGPEEIERVIAACSGEHRLRDRAAILLLARLGLRASEVAGLEFDHIDWRNGRIAVAGKMRRAEWLPLTQEVGDALIAYIERARPRLATPRVFVTDVTPVRPMTRTCVKHIVRSALARAGVRSARQGAHILRHSAATQMLRHGVSLAGVGAVLRHRFLTMTMHYAKVDFALLSEIAQPWAGRPAC
jgi:integrase/recombinase XerD